MADSKTRLLHLVTTLASAFYFSHYPVQGIPYPVLPSTSRAPPHPPPLPQYYATSSQRPPSPQSSLAPTSPVYTASRIRPNTYSSGPDYDDPYPSSANLGTAVTSAGGQSEEDGRGNTGFVEPIDFSSLLKDVGSSPKGVGLDIGESNPNPLFASESKDTFQGFFGSTKNPFEELNRLNTASSEQSSRRQNGDGGNLGFVDPNVQFRSLFDSAGPSASSSGFRPQDFLGSKSENIGSAPSKASQTRAYPSYTYSGRGEDDDREDSDRDDYYGGGNSGPSGPNRYRSSYRQVGGGEPDYYGNSSPEESDSNRPFGYDRVSNSPSDSYDDGPSGPSYYAPSPGGPNRSGGLDGDYERPTPRYSPQATNAAPQTKAKAETSASSKNPRCKKVEKTVDYGEDHASFTDPEPDYDPSTYQSRYKRQARQRGGRGGSSNGGGRGGSPKRPMTCYVCEDEHGRYAEKCSYDSNGSPSNNNGNNYFHSESSSYSDNGNNNNGRRNYGGKGKERTRRTAVSGNRQRSTFPTPRKDDYESSASTTKSVSLPPPEIAESEPKVVEKRQSGGGFDTDNPNFDFGSNPNREGDGDPYDASSGSYRHPSGYEGPPLSSIGGAATNRGGGGGFNAPGSGGGYHGGGRGFHGGGGGYHGGRGGRGGGGDEGYGSPQEYFGSVPDYEREAAQATREYDFSIPREFDPDVQLGPNGGGGGRSRGGGRGHGGHHQRRGSEDYGGEQRGGSPRADQAGGFRPFNPHRRNNGPHQSASTNSNRRSALDDFDIGYNDYVRSYFPEASNSPASFGPTSESTSSYNPSNYEFQPNYYHRPRGGHNREEDPSHETSNSSPSHDHHSHRGGHGGGRGGFGPHRESTQPSHNFAPPPGFFSEDAPAYENYENLGNIMKDFSTRSRDGCQKVNKGDMTCYVCKDAKGMKKEECIYASNDPRNKAMAYHEVAEYSSPTASVLPAPHHLSSSEESPSFEISSDQDLGESRESGIAITSTPASTETTSHEENDHKANGSSVVTAKSSTKVKKASSPADKNKNKHSNRTSKSTTIQRHSTVIVHERSKRSLSKHRRLSVDNYDFDY